MAYKKVVAYLSSYSIVPDYSDQMTPQITMEAHFSILISCFIYLFFLVSVPFFILAFAEKLNITRKNWYKVVIGLEVIAILFAFFGTPPDMTSTILVFMLLQVPVIINIFSLLRATGNRTKNE
ncbi:MAG: hypothetical protein DWQ02_27865 [Bacteroidetes bacterium]|nr:MAG: hypothetical protein DWQ02_27865 [Bacteroidota bacterium]